jgi:hypothetical protein
MQDKYGNYVGYRDVVVKDGEKIQILADSSSAKFLDNTCLGVTIETKYRNILVVNVEDTELLSIEEYPEYYV